MPFGDILGIAVLALAYGFTWILLIRSLRIVRVIDTEKLKHIDQIRQRVKPGKSGASDA